jgi:hypothetical protein
MSKNKKMTIPAWTPVRDPLMVLLINGATKGGAHADRKKQDNKYKCRTKVSYEE